MLRAITSAALAARESRGSLTTSVKCYSKTSAQTGVATSKRSRRRNEERLPGGSPSRSDPCVWTRKPCTDRRRLLALALLAARLLRGRLLRGRLLRGRLLRRRLLRGRLAAALRLALAAANLATRTLDGELAVLVGAHVVHEVGVV